MLREIFYSRSRRIAISGLVIGLGVGVSACSRPTIWTAEEKQNARFVLDAWDAVNDEAKISNKSNSILRKEDVAAMAEKLRSAMESAQRVEDPVLDKINSGLRVRWKGQFIEGLRLRLKNLESEDGDVQAELLGSSMLDRFSDWMMANRRNIKIPKVK